MIVVAIYIIGIVITILLLPYIQTDPEQSPGLDFTIVVLWPMMILMVFIVLLFCLPAFVKYYLSKLYKKNGWLK